MKPWEVWDCPFPWGEHPAVIVSNSVRVEIKPQIVVLACRTMSKSASRDPVGCEALLDEADGLDWKTLCGCDLMYTIDKEILKRRRGEVGTERRREIATKIQQGLAIAGL
jgi:mRNA-degrading endonuclease toxin of MazEF toxin-antitoxin module